MPRTDARFLLLALERRAGDALVDVRSTWVPRCRLALTAYPCNRPFVQFAFNRSNGAASLPF